MNKNEKSIKDLMEKIENNLSKKEQIYILGVIEGFKLARIAVNEYEGLILREFMENLKRSTTKEEFELIMEIAKEDIRFHKNIGTIYSVERVAAVLNQSATLVKIL